MVKYSFHQFKGPHLTTSKLSFLGFWAEPRTPALRLFPSGMGKMKSPPGKTPGGHRSGGPEGIRTLDLCVANAALSQLSYRPLDTLYYIGVGILCLPDIILHLRVD